MNESSERGGGGGSRPKRTTVREIELGEWRISVVWSGLVWSGGAQFGQKIGKGGIL